MTRSLSVQVLWRFPIEATKGGEPAKGARPKLCRAIAIGDGGLFHVVSFAADAAIGVDLAAMPEVSFSIEEGIAHCEAVLSGNQQAMTRPGGMRIVAATAKILHGLLAEEGAAALIGKRIAGGAAG